MCNNNSIILTHYSHMSPSDITAIQNALLHKCMDYGRVVHIVVDKRSLFVSYISVAQYLFVLVCISRLEEVCSHSGITISYV